MTGKHKVIIDTNLWISFLLSKKFDFIDSMLNTGKVQLIFCIELLEELADVTSRPKLSKFFTRNEWNLIFDIIDRCAIYIPVISNVNVCRDVKDNFLLSLAKDSQADYLLTGDQDLLTLKIFEKTQILTIAEFQIEMK